MTVGNLIAGIMGADDGEVVMLPNEIDRSGNYRTHARRHWRADVAAKSINRRRRCR